MTHALYTRFGWNPILQSERLQRRQHRFSSVLGHGKPPTLTAQLPRSKERRFQCSPWRACRYPPPPLLGASLAHSSDAAGHQCSRRFRSGFAASARRAERGAQVKSRRALGIAPCRVPEKAGKRSEDDRRGSGRGALGVDAERDDLTSRAALLLGKTAGAAPLTFFAERASEGRQPGAFHTNWR